MNLLEAQFGESYKIIDIEARWGTKRTLDDLGFEEGKTVKILKTPYFKENVVRVAMNSHTVVLAEDEAESIIIE